MQHLLVVALLLHRLNILQILLLLLLLVLLLGGVVIEGSLHVDVLLLRSVRVPATPILHHLVAGAPAVILDIQIELGIGRAVGLL